MTQTTRHPLAAAIGDVLTDAATGRTVTVARHDERDHTCHLCGGLVRVWDCYTLVRPKVAGPGAYDTTVLSSHLLNTALLGDCPAQKV
jgi:hypothetical protein